MQFYDVQLSAWAPKLNSFLFRRSPREPAARITNYEDRFDFTTIFYDVFWSDSGKSITIIAPPLLSLRDTIMAGKFLAYPDGSVCEARIRELGPIYHFEIDVPSGSLGLLFQYALGEVYLAPQASLVQQFRDKRVILTVSKNNPLHWIRDWVHYHVQVHGSNALLFYDNNSDLYTKYDLREAVSAIPGLDLVAIVEADFLYGPPPSLFNVNDSRFLQRGLLEHAHHRFVSECSSVFHTDIDELIVSLDNESVHEACEMSTTGYISFNGRWVERVTEHGEDLPVEDINYFTYRYINKPSGRTSAEKWCVSPTRHQPRVYWATHRVYGVSPDAQASSRFEHRHVFGLKTEATDGRNKDRLAKTPVERIDPDRHVEDRLLTDTLLQAFDTHQYRQLPSIPPFRYKIEGDVARVYAGASEKAGQFQSALDMVEDALRLSPDHPSYHDFRAVCLDGLDRGEEASQARTLAEQLRRLDVRYMIHLARDARLNRRLPEAKTLVEGLVERHPENPECHFAHGEVLSALRDYAGAADAFRRAVQCGLNNCDVYWRYGVDAARAGRMSEAASAFDKMLSVPPTSFEELLKYFRGRIDLCERAGDLNGVRSYSLEAINKIGKHGKMTISLLREFEAKSKTGQEENSTSAL